MGNNPKSSKIPGPTYDADIRILGNILAVRAVQDRYRVQIPRNVRDKLKISLNDNVFWVEFEGRICLCKAGKLT